MIFHCKHSSVVILLLLAFFFNVSGYGQQYSFHLDSLCDFRDTLFIEDTLVVVGELCDLIRERGFTDDVLMRESFLKSDTLWGISSIYDSNGKIRLLENYSRGCLDGLTIGFWPNGKISFFGYYECVEIDTFITDTVLYLHPLSGDQLLKIYSTPTYSVKTGNWIYYDESGKIIRREIWRDDELIEVIELD
jgi:uncharacterized protein YuzE